MFTSIATLVLYSLKMLLLCLMKAMLSNTCMFLSVQNYPALKKYMEEKMLESCNHELLPHLKKLKGGKMNPTGKILFLSCFTGI